MTPKKLCLLWGGLIFLYGSLCYADLTQQINKILTTLETCPESEFWKTVHTLELLGDDAIDIVLEKYSSSPLKVQLGCAKFLCSVGELDAGFDILFQIVQSTDPNTSRDLKIQAAELLVVEGDSSLESRLEELLDQTFDPFLKIPLSKALLMTCGNSRGRKELAALLASDNTNVKLEAALALAEIGNFDQSQIVLGVFQREPSLKGQLSRALLKKDKMLKRYEQLLFQYRKIPIAQSSDFEDQILDEIYQTVRNYHIYGDRYTKEFLTFASINGILNHYDLESFVLEEKELLVSNSLQDRELGLVLGYQSRYLVVTSVLFNGPAYLAGIQAGDVITSINDWPTYYKSRKAVNERILYSAWKNVTIEPTKGIVKNDPQPLTVKVSRSGWPKSRDFVLSPITEKKSKIPTTKTPLLSEGIGYLFLPEISREMVQSALEQLNHWDKNKECHALLLDLRGCATGSLAAMSQFAEAFLPPEKILYREKGKNLELLPEQEYKTSQPAIFPHLSVVVLVDHGTAFVGEILAGALKQNQRAIVIGTRTSGEGSIQKLIPLTSVTGHYLNLTVGFYEFSNGTPVHRKYHPNLQGGSTKSGGLLPDEFAQNTDNEKSWYQEEEQNLSETDLFKSHIQALTPEIISSILTAPLAGNESIQTLHQKLLTPLPIEEFTFFYRMTLQKKYASLKNEIILDLYNDPFLRLGLSYCLKFLQKDPQETAFRSLGLEKK